MPLWTPSKISTALWLDGSDASTLFDATTGGSLVAADAGVARWEDKSGNARHVTQATAANRPLRRTNVKNSLDALQFDGTNDILETTFVAFGSSYCFVAVAVGTNAASSSGAIVATRSKTTGVPVNPQAAYSSGTSQFGVRDDAGNINSNSMSGVAGATYYLFGGERSGNNVTAYRDGVAGTLGSNSLGTITATVTSVGALYPGSATPNTFLSGHIAEIVFGPVADHVIIEGYLAWKWGMAASLAGGHAYKSAAPIVAGSAGRLINGTSLVRPAGIADHSSLIIGAT